MPNKVLQYEALNNLGIEREGKLLTCPICYEKDMKEFGKYCSLGSVNNDNQLIIFRKNHQVTIVQAEKFMVICGCGYIFNYNNGALSTSNISNGYEQKKESNNYWG